MTVLIVTSTFLVDTLPFRGTGIRMAVTISFIQTIYNKSKSLQKIGTIYTEPVLFEQPSIIMIIIPSC